jgi:ParB family chromosome partitioning protein
LGALVCEEAQLGSARASMVRAGGRRIEDPASARPHGAAVGRFSVKKSAFEAPRVGGFHRFKPDEIVIPGVDDDRDASYALHDVSARHSIDEAMVLSILRDGVHTPVKVRKDGERPEIVDGRRRVLHAREANRRLLAGGASPEDLVTIVAEVHRFASDKDAVLMMLSANAFALAEDPIDRAQKVARVLKLGASMEDAAKCIGVSSVTAIKDMLRILDCSDVVKAAVQRREIAASAAIELATLRRDEQDRALTRLIETGSRTAKDAARVALEASGDSPASGGRGASAAFAPGRKDLRAACEHARGQNGEYWRGLLAGLRYALGEEIPPELQEQIERMTVERGRRRRSA